jgi:Big-like domain-containing protein
LRCTRWLFRADGFGDPNTLYFTSQLTNENDGLFAAITTGLVSTIRVSAQDTPTDTSFTVTATVTPGRGNAGTPTGSVTFWDGSNRLGTSPVINGAATLTAILSEVGVHTINAQYSGDAAFLSSSDRIPLQVTALATTSTLAAPADAAPGSTLTLTATINSAGGIPTGQVVFLDGATSLGSSVLDDAGVATFRNNSLSAGTHILTASYEGDGKFGASTSAGVTINIANPDFTLGAAPPTATVLAGQSTQFLLTVTPAGGFADNVTFSCSPVSGISCTFNPAMIAPTNAAATTTLTVTTSATVSRYGFLVLGLACPGAFLTALAFLSLVLWKDEYLRNARSSRLATSAAAVIVTLGLAIGGCGGYSSGAQPNRGTASILVTAQSGNISHTTTVRVTVQ